VLQASVSADRSPARRPTAAPGAQQRRCGSRKVLDAEYGMTQEPQRTLAQGATGKDVHARSLFGFRAIYVSGPFWLATVQRESLCSMSK